MDREKSRVITVDANNMVMGRLASIIAKELLNGNKVTVVNVEKVVITGSNKKSILEHFFKKLRARSNVNPRRHGPFVSRSPEGIFKRVVRGMLPWEKAKGKEAYKRLRVYRGIPKNIDTASITVYKSACYRENPYPYMYLDEISRLIGWIPIKERIREML